jgi:hypothetical protein
MPAARARSAIARMYAGGATPRRSPRVTGRGDASTMARAFSSSAGDGIAPPRPPAVQSPRAATIAAQSSGS